jgi:transcriptional regulator with XRE-family HTH domain
MAYLSPEESRLWLKTRLQESGLKTIDNLAKKTGINKGTISKYFRQKQRPTVDVLVVLAGAMELSPSDVLIGLGALPHEN